MCRIPFQIFWQINNRNRLEGTFLDTNTATLVVKKLGTLELVRAVSLYSRCRYTCIYGETGFVTHHHTYRYIVVLIWMLIYSSHPLQYKVYPVWLRDTISYIPDDISWADIDRYWQLQYVPVHLPYCLSYHQLSSLVASCMNDCVRVSTFHTLIR